MNISLRLRYLYLLIMALSDKGYFVEQPLYNVDVTKRKYIMS